MTTQELPKDSIGTCVVLPKIGMGVDPKIPGLKNYSSLGLSVWGEKVVFDESKRGELYEELYNELLQQFADKLRRFREATGI